VTADTNGGNVQRQLYKAWGEVRTGSLNALATRYTFTGQAAEDSLGLMFYRARWYDPLLGRFVSADTIVPGAYDPLAHDRYAYVRSNPLRYVDPSGHKACIEFDENGRCIQDPDWHPTSSWKFPSWTKVPAGKDQPVESYNYGLGFVSLLKENPGWWSTYVTNPKRMWRFLIALAYGYEIGGAWNNSSMQELMPQAFANKLTSLVSEYGAAGYYIFLGSMETIRIRLVAVQRGTLIAPDKLNDAFTLSSGIMDGSYSSSNPNAPYDFANPMPGKHPEELLDRLYAFANTCQDKVDGCDTRNLNGTLYVLASWNEKVDDWDIAFIVSLAQETSWWK
jgi:RHS repeat-associated protein